MTSLGHVHPLGPNVWRGSEEAVKRSILRRSLDPDTTVICLRRQVPSWWSTLPSFSGQLTLLHFPVPGISDAKCVERVVALATSGWLDRRPLLWFCWEGIHRTGLVATAAVYLRTRSVPLARRQFFGRDNPPGSLGAITLQELIALLQLEPQAK